MTEAMAMPLACVPAELGSVTAQALPALLDALQWTSTSRVHAIRVAPPQACTSVHQVGCAHKIETFLLTLNFVIKKAIATRNVVVHSFTRQSCKTSK